MDKLRAVLAMVLAMLMTFGAMAEGELALDLAGNFGALDEVEIAANDAQQIDILDADLLVGYVAASGAQVNPFLCNERDLVSMNRLVFESMVELDETQKPSPMLADNWEHEGNLWKFTLRSGITFHNGAELNAWDVQSSYDQFVAMDDGYNPYSPRIRMLIKNLEAIDDHTVAVEGKYPGYITLYALTFPVVQSTTIFDDMPRGTGPFWYVRYDMDSAIRIEANPLWWQQQPTLSSVTFRRYAQSGDAIEALQTNQIEMLATQNSSAAICRKLSDLTAMDYATTVYELLVPNLGAGSVMSNVKVRQAVMYAIDRAMIASNSYLDMAIQSEVPIQPGSWLYESQSAQYYYSPERALQLLYDAGWKDLTGDMVLDKLDGIKLSELTVNIVTYNEDAASIRENAANQIAGYLNAVGVKTTVEVLETKALKDRIKYGQYDLALIGLNFSEVPAMVGLLGTDGNMNFNNYNDSVMNSLLTQTAEAADETAMKQVYSQLQMKIVENLPVMGLLFRAGTVLSDRSLGGLEGIRVTDTFRGLQYLNE
ncbi:MAG: ABC transporter substrate-binding protein [Clostridia bacterium]|nr:ABC transporter substrate-binding protein [Clostridia bacterium]